MEYTQIELTVSNAVATITLDRPERLNAFTGTMMNELIDACDRIDADPEVRVAVITGRGRGFCAGADLESGADTFNYAENDDLAPAHRDGGGQAALRFYSLTKPIIAAINGPAVGVGATMTLPMDIRLASTHARFGFVFGKRGIVIDGCASWFLPRIVGISTAMEWCSTGRVMPASDALAAGLIRSIHEPDRLLPAAYELAEEIASSVAPVSASLMRSMLWRMLSAEHPMDAHRIESKLIAERGASDDAREGIESFLEKRAARYALKVPNDLPPDWKWWTEPTF
jgi:enoyl-CoA hydratase/carnithine racemase